MKFKFIYWQRTLVLKRIIKAINFKDPKVARYPMLTLLFILSMLCPTLTHAIKAFTIVFGFPSTILSVAPVLPLSGGGFTHSWVLAAPFTVLSL